jgi:hypothetical protein
MPFDPVKKFWSKVNKNGPIHPVHGQCWIWEGSIGQYGYGQVGRRRKLIGTHRYAWTISNGDIPKGMGVLHKCDNRPCVNPDHLFLGTFKDNMNDKVRKGRQAFLKGESNGRSVLTEESVKYIRSMYIKGHPLYGGVALSKKFGVTETMISYVVKRKFWTHV